MTAFALSCVYVAFTVASGLIRHDGHNSSLRSTNITQTWPTSALTSVQGPWTLRVCNAYSFQSSLDVLHAPSAGPRTEVQHKKTVHESLIGDGEATLAYKACEDFTDVKKIGPGSEIVFRLTSGLLVGSFVVSELPPAGRMMLLVIHRHDDFTTAADFSSHVYSPSSPNDDEVEVAMIDAYRGKGKSDLELYVPSTYRMQILHYETSVRIRPGWYEWFLQDPKKPRNGDGLGFHLHTGENYVVLRVGAEALRGPWYPEELVSFPGANTVVHSSSFRPKGIPTDIMLLIFAVSLFW